MLHKIASFFVILICFGCTGQTTKTSEIEKPSTTYTYNTAHLLAHVKELSSDVYEGRATGTKGAAKAKAYIISEFKKLNVLPLGERFEQTFPVSKTDSLHIGKNVFGLVKGTEYPEEYIVISAHYDHVGIKDGKVYNGADDDASGISALFAFAEIFQKNPPKHSVILAAFDAEEIGLLGSYYFVDHAIVLKTALKLNINMDMISRSAKKELFAVGPQHYEQLVPLIENLEKPASVKLTIAHEEWTYSSDHAGFHKANIPFVYFGVADHKDYHQPTDDFENIHPEFYKDVVQTIITFFHAVDNTAL